MQNTRRFLAETLVSLAASGNTAWLFGGWAEELWAVSGPRNHNDIDLLYQAENFDRLQTFIEDSPHMTEIAPKRFSHKRAVLYHGVMVEFFLVQQCEQGLFTNFFSGARVFHWPTDTLSCTTLLAGGNVNIASRQALADYRKSHAEIEIAYQEFVRRH